MENIALMSIGKANQTISSRQVAEATGKEHKHVMRDIRELIEKGAIDCVLDLSPNLDSINEEPICIESSYIAGNGKANPEYLLNEFAANVLAASYDPVIARKLLKLVRELKKAIETQHRLPQSFSEALMLAARQAEEIERKDLQLQEQKPKVLFADSVATSKTSILVGELAKLINQNGVDIGANRLFDYLRENGYLIKRKGSDYNMPTQKAMDLKLFEIKERTINNPDGTIRLTKTSKVTGKGQVFFVDHFLRLFKPEKL